MSGHTDSIAALKSTLNIKGIPVNLRHIPLSVCIMLSTIAGSTWAQDPEEFELTSPKNYISDFPNEVVAVQDLKLGFNYTDISIPGNNGLDLMITRDYVRSSWRPYVGFGVNGWYPEIPYIITTNDTSNSITPLNFECLGSRESVNVYIDGKKLRARGFSSSAKIPSNAITALSNQSILKCESGNPVLMMTDGTTITLGTSYEQSVSGNSTKYYVVSKVEDQFGNNLVYSYQNENDDFNGVRKKLTQIVRSDGATASLSYEKVGAYERIKSISSEGRTLDYQYTNDFLTRVDDGEGRQTSYVYHTYVRSTGFMKSVTLPSGLKAEYTHYPVSGEGANQGSISSKTISGPGIQTRTFHHEFPTFFNNKRAIQIEFNVEPGWEITREWVLNRLPTPSWGYSTGEVTTNGALTDMRIYKSPQIARLRQDYVNDEVLYEKSFTWDYTVAGNVGCAHRIGTSFAQYRSCGHKYLTSSEVRINNGGIYDTFTTTYSNHNQYGDAEKQVESNSFSSDKRYSKFTFENNAAEWLIGRINTHKQSSVDSSYLTVQDYDYYSATGPYKGKIKSVREFGETKASFSHYHGNGELKTAKSANDNTYSYTNIYRGQAKNIVLPGVSQAKILELNPDGNVKSATDHNLNKTSYYYDSIGRLTRLTHPLENGTSTWNDEILTYTKVSASDLSIANSNLVSGQTKETLTKGNLQRITFLDGRENATLEKIVNLDNTSEVRYVNYAYDLQGRLIFRSFPSTNAGEPNGLSIERDLLGRPTQITEEGKSVTFEYLSNNRKRVTDPRGNETTYTYQAFGKYDYSKATKIESPEGVTTTIDRNIFGEPTSITQSGLYAGTNVSSTRTYEYDSRQLLCRTYDPEFGYTAHKFDNEGNLDWTWIGTSTNYCNSSSAAPLSATDYVYNANNKITNINYPSGTSDISFDYDANGNITGANHAGANWDYQYNSLNKLKKETLAIDGRAFNLTYAYNDNRDRSSVTYPSGRVVTFAPNAFGQPTKAGTFARSVSYFATGKVKQFTYGNNKTYSLTLNDDLFPERIFVSGITDLNYTYDDSNNVKTIVDGRNSAENRAMTYDSLDRLKTVSGPWGNSSYSYDPLGNIMKKTLGNKTYTYNYNRTKNRLTSMAGAKSYTFGYDSQGNIKSNGSHNFTFDKGNMMTSVNSGNVASYVYDAHKRRARVRQNSNNVYHIYNKEGQLLHTYDVGANDESDYVYLENMQVAKISDDAPAKTKPLRPSEISIPNVDTDGSFRVNWVTSDGSETYTLQQQKNGGSWSTIYSGSRNYKDVTLTSGDYRFRVRGTNGSGSSAYLTSTTTDVDIPTIPSVPGGVSAPFSTNLIRFDVYWNSSVGATRYEVEQSVSFGAFILKQNNSSTSYEAIGRLGREYLHRVRACNDLGCSAWSAQKYTIVTSGPGGGGIPRISIKEEKTEIKQDGTGE